MRNLSAHGVFGAALFVLVVLHHILNCGKYNSVLVAGGMIAFSHFLMNFLEFLRSKNSRVRD